MDRHAYRHPPPAHRRRWRTDIRSGDAGWQKSSRSCRDGRRAYGPHHCRDDDAGRYLPGDGDPGAGEARHDPRCCFRCASGLLGLRLRARRCRQFHPRRAGGDRSCHRRRDLFAHSRLARSRHLRALRRRCGRGGRGTGGDGGKRDRRAQAAVVHPVDPPSFGRSLSRHSLRRRRPLENGHRRQIADVRPRGVPARHFVLWRWPPTKPCRQTS